MLHASTDNMTFTLWQPDGAGILFVSRSFDTYAGPPAQVWRLPYPSGVARQVTRDLLDYRSLSITADGTTLTAVGAQYQVASISSRPARRISAAARSRLNATTASSASRRWLTGP